MKEYFEPNWQIVDGDERLLCGVEGHLALGEVRPHGKRRAGQSFWEITLSKKLVIKHFGSCYTSFGVVLQHGSDKIGRSRTDSVFGNDVLSSLDATVGLLKNLLK